VLVNPGVALPTAQVFGALNVRTGTGTLRPPRKLDSLWDVIGYLGDAGNDLEAPACRIAPVIQDVLNAFDREPGCALAQMSGSGSTCFAFFHEHEFARGAAERIAQDHPQWWISLTTIAGLHAGAAEQV
jgi:4-diphosphocytidyl-2-C-methyl-D-erythritol kinase